MWEFLIRSGVDPIAALNFMQKRGLKMRGGGKRGRAAADDSSQGAIPAVFIKPTIMEDDDPRVAAALNLKNVDMVVFLESLAINDLESMSQWIQENKPLNINNKIENNK